MSSDVNIQILRDAYNAFGSGDIQTFSQLLAPHAVWTMPGTSPIAGRYVGTEQILGYLAKLVEMTGGDVKIDLEHVASDGVVTFTQHRTQASREGRQMDSRTVLVVRTEGGLITEVHDAPFDLHSVDEFWS